MASIVNNVCGLGHVHFGLNIYKGVHFWGLYTKVGGFGKFHIVLI